MRRATANDGLTARLQGVFIALGTLDSKIISWDPLGIIC